MTTKLVNLTPHSLGVADAEGKIILTIPSTGSVRVATSATPSGEVEVEGFVVSMVETTYGQPVGLPEPDGDTLFIVSQLVTSALREQGIVRTDVVAPDTGPDSVVRDAAGQILGVKRFTR